jgi:sulfite dehydrogenase (quinone) subunit SoeA
MQDPTARSDLDGALLLAWIREIIHQGLYDRDFLIRYTNAAELVSLDPGSPEEGLFVRGQRAFQDCLGYLELRGDLRDAVATHAPEPRCDQKGRRV